MSCLQCFYIFKKIERYIESYLRLIIKLALLLETRYRFPASQLLFESITMYCDYYAPHDAYN